MYKGVVRFFVSEEDIQNALMSLRTKLIAEKKNI